MRAVYALAEHASPEPMKIAEIAEKEQIPIRFLEVILNQLKARWGRAEPAGSRGRLSPGAGRRPAHRRRDNALHRWPDRARRLRQPDAAEGLRIPRRMPLVLGPGGLPWQRFSLRSSSQKRSGTSEGFTSTISRSFGRPGEPPEERDATSGRRTVNSTHESTMTSDNHLGFHPVTLHSNSRITFQSSLHGQLVPSWSHRIRPRGRAANVKRYLPKKPEPSAKPIFGDSQPFSIGLFTNRDAV